MQVDQLNADYYLSLVEKGPSHVSTKSKSKRESSYPILSDSDFKRLNGLTRQSKMILSERWPLIQILKAESERICSFDYSRRLSGEARSGLPILEKERWTFRMFKVSKKTDDLHASDCRTPSSN